METCVRPCAFARRAVCEWPVSMRTEPGIKSGTYVKVLVFSSHFLLMFMLTVSTQTEREKIDLQMEWRENRKLSFLLHGAAKEKPHRTNTLCPHVLLLPNR